MYSRNRYINTLLGCLDDQLEELRNSAEGVMDGLNSYYADSLSAEIAYHHAVATLVESIHRFYKRWHELTSSIDEVKEKGQYDPSETADVRVILDSYIKKQDVNIKTLVDKFEAVAETMVESNNNTLFDLDCRINPAIPILRQQNHIKSKTLPHIALRQDITDEDLILQYQLNGNTISKEMVETFKMSYQGIRNRLIKAGVYCSKR